jgi:hypothetical protein
VAEDAEEGDLSYRATACGSALPISVRPASLRTDSWQGEHSFIPHPCLVETGTVH